MAVENMDIGTAVAATGLNWLDEAAVAAVAAEAEYTAVAVGDGIELPAACTEVVVGSTESTEVANIAADVGTTVRTAVAVELVVSELAEESTVGHYTADSVDRTVAGDSAESDSQAAQEECCIGSSKTRFNFGLTVCSDKPDLSTLSVTRQRRRR